MGKIVSKRVCLIYSNRREKVNKFSIIELVEEGKSYKIVTRYGKLGGNPIVREKTYKYRIYAVELLERRKAEKIKKGYIEVELEHILASDGKKYFD